MDVNQVLAELDRLFDEGRAGEIPAFLDKNIEDARAAGADDVLLNLYNEGIGFYRENGEYDKSIGYCKLAGGLLDAMGLNGTLPYATTLLNMANAHRAAGLLDESLDLYNQVRAIYDDKLEKGDAAFAGLYNNLSLLYQEKGDFEAAYEQLINALGIVSKGSNARFEVAVTQANLANTCIELGRDDEAKERALEAKRIFEDIGVDDAHYGAALSALGSLCYIDKDYAGALDMMQSARECVERYLGTENIQYQRLTESIDIVRERLEAEEKKTEKKTEMKTETEADDIKRGNQSESTEYENGRSFDINSAFADIKAAAEGKLQKPEEESEAPLEETEAPEEETEAPLEEESEEAPAYDEDKAVDAVIAEIMGEIAGEVEEAEEEQEIEEVEEIEEIEDFSPAISGLDLCRRYYEECGKPMIAEKFADYEGKIAVGLVGKGSDCFGFDDALSADHDYGPRLVMWVTRETYDEIGERLEAEYEKLPDEFMGIKRIETFHGRDRAGVMVIEDFYKNTIGVDLLGAIQKNDDSKDMTAVKDWLAAQSYALAAAVNGEVFRDDEGIFTSYREQLLSYYPKPVLYRKLAQACALFSQNGQYNLPRMRRRGQLVSAQLAKAECARQAMQIYYLLNRKYAPHDKWLFKGLPDNPDMALEEEGQPVKTFAQLVEEVCLTPADKAHAEQLDMAVESIAVIFANELERQNIIGSSDTYLDANTHELMAKSDALLAVQRTGAPSNKALSLAIARAEFDAFDKVQNEGGRASCQNDWNTFRIMRMSQYMTWDEDMLLQYLYEFRDNLAKGRNMVEEKYARMMKSTAPEQYAEFADRLSEVPPEKQEIIEQIVSLQVGWMEEFAAAYPKLGANARAIHTYEDLPNDTSYETYLRGELETYSDRMLEMYGRYVAEYAREGKSVTEDIMANTISFYGYKSFEEAEEKA